LVAHILYHKFKQGLDWQELIRFYETHWKQFFVSKHSKIEDKDDIKLYIRNKFREETQFIEQVQIMLYLGAGSIEE